MHSHALLHLLVAGAGRRQRRRRAVNRYRLFTSRKYRSRPFKRQRRKIAFRSGRPTRLPPASAAGARVRGPPPDLLYLPPLSPLYVCTTGRTRRGGEGGGERERERER